MNSGPEQIKRAICQCVWNRVDAVMLKVVKPKMTSERYLKGLVSRLVFHVPPAAEGLGSSFHVLVRRSGQKKPQEKHWV